MNQQLVQVVLPAHNEAGSIGQTLSEFHEKALTIEGVDVQFIVCEDGSTDNTVAVLQELSEKIPLKLISDPVRKGYSRAVIDGFKAADAPLVAFIDSDGQCDPADFPAFLKAIQSADLVVGFRNPRRDSAIRKGMSLMFKGAFRLLFGPSIKDPSCPYLLIRREALERMMQGDLGILKQGFWWEFTARAKSAGLRLSQVPVNHRVRTSGSTQVYKPTKVPRIAFEHLYGLIVLRRELKGRRNSSSPSE